MKFIYDLHKTMLIQNLLLVYEGEFTQEITKSVLAMAERNMVSFGESPRVQRKVFNVMVECLQNIFKHYAEFDEATYGKNNAIFMIGKSDEAYIITSGNAVVNDEVKNITARVEEINNLDLEGIKLLYRKKLKEKKNQGDAGLTPKGGAGLGFIDMAKRSGHKLIYDFESINDHLSFFSLKVTISRDV